MTEYQKIAIGLLGLSHPEIYLLARRAAQGPDDRSTGRGGRASLTNALVSGIKFAFAALLTGSRITPLGDNRHLTKELGAYGVRLRRCG